MASSYLSFLCCCYCVIICVVRAQTLFGFYDFSCPQAELIVKNTVQRHSHADVTIPAALLRLHFHDCFVQGCDGSILINGFNTEKTSPANSGLRGFEVIDDAKSKIEAICPGVVSCADILALAARDAVELSNGPSWRVPLGRRDGLTSFASDASSLPSPQDSVLTLKEKFASKGLSAEDLVILVGAHTIGQADCRFFSYRLYNYHQTSESDPSMDSTFLEELRNICPNHGDGSPRVPLDRGSQTYFDTSFFKNVINGYGVLESDQKLMLDETTATYVKQYGGINNGRVFGGSLTPNFEFAFSNSMIKMGNIEVKVDKQGEIRRVCSSFNS